METKTCKTCGQEKPLDEFSKTWRKRTKVPSHWCWHADCKVCNTQQSLKWQKDNWEHVKKYRETDKYKRYSRNNWLLRTYHVTLAWYEEQYAKQNGKCAICGKAEQSLGPGRKTKDVLAVDHDHKCCPGKTSCGKCVRGLLCTHCNHMLGSGMDDVAILQSAIIFLKNLQQDKKETGESQCRMPLQSVGGSPEPSN
jgi:hypothetical protein